MYRALAFSPSSRTEFFWLVTVLAMPSLWPCCRETRGCHLCEAIPPLLAPTSPRHYLYRDPLCHSADGQPERLEERKSCSASCFTFSEYLIS